jgi:hypothetical protein
MFNQLCFYLFNEETSSLLQAFRVQLWIRCGPALRGIKRPTGLLGLFLAIPTAMQHVPGF